MNNSALNREIASVLYEMAELLELHAENRFKIIAYGKAARAIESLNEDIEKVCRERRLQSIPGVGKAIAEKVEEYLRTGSIQSHQDLLKDTPAGLAELLKISGLGPKTIFMLHEKLNITNLDDARKGRKGAPHPQASQDGASQREEHPEVHREIQEAQHSHSLQHG